MSGLAFLAFCFVCLVGWFGAKRSGIALDEELNWDNKNPLIVRLCIYLAGYFLYFCESLLMRALLGFQAAATYLSSGLKILCIVLLFISYPVSLWEWFSTDHYAFWAGFKELVWALVPVLNVFYAFDFSGSPTVLAIHTLAFIKSNFAAIFWTSIGVAICFGFVTTELDEDMKNWNARLERIPRYLENQLAKRKYERSRCCADQQEKSGSSNKRFSGEILSSEIDKQRKNADWTE